MPTDARSRWFSLLLVLALVPHTAGASPFDRMQVQGVLTTSSGVPADGTYTVVLGIYAAETGGSPLYAQSLSSVVVTGGLFDAVLGPLPPSLGDQAALWLEARVGAEPPLPRRPILAVPLAGTAARALAADVAKDLACSGCVSSAEVSFPYAASASAGGAALDLACSGCVSSAEVSFPFALGDAKAGAALDLSCSGCVGTGHIADGTIAAADVGFTYAGSLSKGGPASDVACSGCVASSDLAANLALVGDLSVTGAVAACTAGAAGCGVTFGAGGAGGAVRVPGDGTLHLRTGGSVRVRTTDNGAWAPLEAGGLFAHGALAAEGATTLATPVTVSGPGALTVTAADGAVRLVVDAAGKVGIGTGSPKQRLDVAGALHLNANPAYGLRLEPSDGEPVACGDATAGYVYFDTTSHAGWICDGAVWKPLTGGSSPGSGDEGDGSDAAHAATNCTTLKQAWPAKPTGTYWVDPNGGGTGDAFPVLCEMAKEGGGWTLLTNHQATAGYFGDLSTALAYNTGNPTAPLYSILGKVDQFKGANGYELLYWNRQHDVFVVNRQASSPLDSFLAGGCAQQNVIVSSNYTPGLFCGYTPGPVGWTAINGYGPNWTHAVGQFKVYSSWPLVCTHDTGYQCNHYQLWVRGLPSQPSSGPGSSQAQAVADCQALKTVSPTAPSGVYWIDPTGGDTGDAFQARCEMEFQGGGWTLLTNHFAPAGYFGNLTNALSYGTGNPTGALYSILGKIGQFKKGGKYELLYWNRQFDTWIINTQTADPLDQSKAGGCATGSVVINSNYTPDLFCGYTPGPGGWTAINGYGPNWTHAVGQFQTYSSWPLVCTHNSGYQCNHYQFYVR